MMLLAPAHTHSNIFSISWLPFSLNLPENGICTVHSNIWAT